MRLPLFWLIGLLAISGCNSQQASFEQSVPWGLTGQWLVMDSHTHTTFSDGASSVGDVVDQAMASGCDVVAITDHGDRDRGALTPDYFSAINAARAKNPTLLIVTGFEWNIPPYNGREHMTVLADSPIDTRDLPAFRQQFEHNGTQASAAMQWLDARAGQGAVMIYNHPSRKGNDAAEKSRDMETWRAVSPSVIGFEGGPGHQKAASPGDYNETFRTQERWDPIVAQVGGSWDQMLDRGQSAWGALASSDYHTDQGDFAPCWFSRTHVQVSSRTTRGVLDALRAGSFWADHGRLLDRLSFIAVSSSLPLPATPGETVRLAKAAPLALRVLLQRGPGAYGKPLNVEIIGNGRSGKPEILLTKNLEPEQSVVDWTPGSMQTGADGASSYFRVRVRTEESEFGPLAAYSNPIRIHWF